jgi:hypothetical protein
MMTGRILATGALTIDEQEKDDSSAGINPTTLGPRRLFQATGAHVIRGSAQL